MELYERELFTEHIKRMEGKMGRLIVEKGNKRTNAQNRYYWGVVVKMISEATGQDDDDIHEFLKGRFNAVDFDIPNKETGEVIEKATIGRTTTKMTTIQFMEYIMQIQQWASEFLHIVIPDPGQVDWL